MTDQEAENYLCSAETETAIKCEIIRKAHFIPLEEQKDLKQICYLHLWIVLRRNYDPARSTPRTFISRCIGNVIKNYFRHTHFRKREVELYTVPLPEDYAKF